MTDQELSKFIGDAENAFSREHTQWIVRKDNQCPYQLGQRGPAAQLDREPP